MKPNEAKKLKQKEANNFFLVSQNEAKRKRSCFCFASFRFKAKTNKKRKWNTLTRTVYPNFFCSFPLWIQFLLTDSLVNPDCSSSFPSWILIIPAHFPHGSWLFRLISLMNPDCSSLFPSGILIIPAPFSPDYSGKFPSWILIIPAHFSPDYSGKFPSWILIVPARFPQGSWLFLLESLPLVGWLNLQNFLIVSTAAITIV